MHRFGRRRAGLFAGTVAAAPPPSGFSTPVSQGTANTIPSDALTTVTLTTLADIAIGDTIALAFLSTGSGSANGGITIADFLSDGTTAISNTYANTNGNFNNAARVLYSFYTIATAAVPAGSKIVATMTSSTGRGKALMGCSFTGSTGYDQAAGSSGIASGPPYEISTTTDNPLANANSMAILAQEFSIDATATIPNNGLISLIDFENPGGSDNRMNLMYLITTSSATLTVGTTISGPRSWVLNLDIFSGA